jgi:hypothetical protein
MRRPTGAPLQVGGQAGRPATHQGVFAANDLIVTKKRNGIGPESPNRSGAAGKPQGEGDSLPQVRPTHLRLPVAGPSLPRD